MSEGFLLEGDIMMRMWCEMPGGCCLEVSSPVKLNHMFRGGYSAVISWRGDGQIFREFASSAGVSVNGSGAIEFEFNAPDPAAFFLIEAE